MREQVKELEEKIREATVFVTCSLRISLRREDALISDFIAKKVEDCEIRIAHYGALLCRDLLP